MGLSKEMLLLQSCRTEPHCWAPQTPELQPLSAAPEMAGEKWCRQQIKRVNIIQPNVHLSSRQRLLPEARLCLSAHKDGSKSVCNRAFQAD